MGDVTRQPLPQETDANNVSELLRQAVSTYARAAYSDRTRRAYDRAWADFSTWCTHQRVCALPASADVVAAWMASRAAGIEGPKWSRNTIALALSGVVALHRSAGYELSRGHPLISQVFRGISRRLTLERPVRQASPLMREELADIVRASGAQPKDMRDIALLLVGWSGALRGSELVALDWDCLGAGRGILSLRKAEILVQLFGTKANSGMQVALTISAREAPTAYAALRAWVDWRGCAPGEPLFTSINRHGQAGARISSRSVSRIVQGRVHHLLRAQGLPRSMATKRSKTFCAHSLRAGFVSSAAAAGVSEAVIQNRTRHRSVAVLRGYVRGAALAPGPLDQLAL